MSKERLQVLMHLDDQARDMQYSLCIQYLRNPRMSKVIESRSSGLAIHAFYWEVTRGYHTFLMDFVANPGGSKIQPAMPLITARAMRGFADIFKWRYFRYEKSRKSSGCALHNLYRIAEFDGFQGNRMKLYAAIPSHRVAWRNMSRPCCFLRWVPAAWPQADRDGGSLAGQLVGVHHPGNRYDPSRHFLYMDTARVSISSASGMHHPETTFRFHRHRTSAWSTWN
jgi:hypothetical protein